jgi:uncharacterized membrane protein
MIRLLNLFSGFAFIGFGFFAFNLIPEFREYYGQQLVMWWVFYSLMFCLTFIIWALTYFYMRDVEDDNRELEKRLEWLEELEETQNRQRYSLDKNQMAFQFEGDDK